MKTQKDSLSTKSLKKVNKIGLTERDIQIE